MSRIRHKRKLNNKIILIISCIITLNIIGVGYSYWINSLYINSTIKTGFMDIDITPKGSNSINLLQGEEGSLYYDIDNNSNFPVDYNGYYHEISSVGENLLTEGITIDYDNESEIVNIIISPDQPAGRYNFNLDLFYIQSN